MNGGLSIGRCALWVLVWVGFMLLYTALDVAVWRRVAPKYEGYLHTLAIVVSIAVYLRLLTRATGFTVDLPGHFSLSGLLWALGGAAVLYLLLDKGLDPVLERIFPASEASYQETLRTLSRAPVASLLQVCVLAPVIEEILMRGYVFDGLSASHGSIVALLVSSLLFALLHFNMVQTLSALVCGLIIGLIYLRTGSLLCSILTHAGYNLVSYLTMILPLYGKP